MTYSISNILCTSQSSYCIGLEGVFFMIKQWCCYCSRQAWVLTTLLIGSHPTLSKSLTAAPHLVLRSVNFDFVLSTFEFVLYGKFCAQKKAKMLLFTPGVLWVEAIILIGTSSTLSRSMTLEPPLMSHHSHYS